MRGLENILIGLEMMIKSKKRIAFIYLPSDEWVGGKNYYLGIFSEIEKYKSNEYDVYIFTSNDVELTELDVLEEITIIKTSRLNRKYNKIRSILNVFVSENIFLIDLFKKHKIDMLSHSYVNYNLSSVESLPWIPDFQYKYLPQLFSEKDIIIRNRRNVKYFKKCNVLLSSYTAENDAKKFFDINKKTFVYRFRPFIPESFKYSGISVFDKYSIPQKYIFIPNQFWQHKNHLIVLDAIKSLCNSYPDICLVSTGNLSDYRNPEYIEKVKKIIDDLECNNNIKLLGLVDRSEYTVLLNNAHFIINPSLFEGWSSTVEESKFYGKMILLSNLEIHKEQTVNYNGVSFFDKNSVNDCQEKIEYLWCSKISEKFTFTNENHYYMDVLSDLYDER